MSSDVCQLYTYHEDSFSLTKNTASYFAKRIVSEIGKVENRKKVFWLNFHSVDDRESINLLAENMGLDRLVIDDLYSEYKRAKIEEYDSYLYFRVKSALVSDKQSWKLDEDKVSFILGDHFLLSFQAKSSDHFPEVRQRIEKKKGKLRLKGPDFLLFRMLEAIMDNYFEVLDDILDTIERIESRILSHHKSDVLKKIEIEKRKLIELRKIVFPLKDIVSQLDKSENNFVKKENHYYFADLKDNCLTILDEIDANKQILEGMANLHYAVQGQRMNEIMKLLTVISTIFIPLTFIVGVYGMNFENMPELKTKYGYFYSMAGMALIAILLLIYFNRRGWLKNK